MNKQNGLIMAAMALSLVSPLYAAEIPVTISGLVEVKADAVEDYAGVSSSDIVLSKVEMGVDAKINDRISAHVAFLHEENATDFRLEEGTISLQLNDATVFTAGRLFVPFGSFDTNMVSDPLTKMLGETSETAIVLDMASGKFSGSLYSFNGDADVTPSINNNSLSFGAGIGYATDNLSLGASYISNLAESKSLQNPGGALASAVAGMGVNLGWHMNRISIIAEHVAALDSFATTDELNRVDGAPFVAPVTEQSPSASNLELAFDTGSATIAAAYQMSQEAAFIGLPESAASVAVSFDVLDAANVGVEYIRTEDYSVANGGSGMSASAFTVKLAVEF